jgi:diguanylate cyclase (GGDEF)-like protein
MGLERRAIPHSAHPLGILTVSAGLAILDPDHPRPAEDVLKEADRALYRAKQGGRNRLEPVTALSCTPHRPPSPAIIEVPLRG